MGKKAEIFWLAANKYLSPIGDDVYNNAHWGHPPGYKDHWKQHCCGALIKACNEVEKVMYSNYFSEQIKPWLNEHFGSYLKESLQFPGRDAETQQMRYAYLMLAYEIAEELDE